MSCDLARDDASLILETDVAFLVVAIGDQGQRVLVARLPGFWTIYSHIRHGSATHWLTVLPAGTQSFYNLVRLGLPNTVSQFVTEVEVIATGENGHALKADPVDKAIQWGGLDSPSQLALRSALSGHALLKTNAVLGKRVWGKLRLLFGRICRSDDQLLDELARFEAPWHAAISCYLLLSKRQLRDRRLQAMRNEPLLAAALFGMRGNRENLGREIFHAIDQRAPVRHFVQAYLGCTREALRYINRAIGSSFTALSTLEFDGLLTAAVLQPIARPESVTELKSVMPDLYQIREIEHLLKSVFQLISVNGADPKAMPNLDVLINHCRVQCGRSIAKNLKAVRSGNTVVDNRSLELLARKWQNAGAGIRRIAMYSRPDVEMPVGLDLDKLSNLSLDKWTVFASGIARAWRGKVTTLGVYAACHQQLATKVWGSFEVAHQDGQPQLSSTIFSDLPRGVHARQILGSQTKQVGLELSNCLLPQADYFHFKLRQGSALLFRFQDIHQISLAEFHLGKNDRVLIKQHSGYRGVKASSCHTEAAQALAHRLQSLYFNTTVMQRAMRVIQEMMNDVTDESQGKFFRMAELMYVARTFRVVRNSNLRIGQLEAEFDAYLEAMGIGDSGPSATEAHDQPTASAKPVNIESGM